MWDWIWEKSSTMFLNLFFLRKGRAVWERRAHRHIARCSGLRLHCLGRSELKRFIRYQRSPIIVNCCNFLAGKVGMEDETCSRPLKQAIRTQLRTEDSDSGKGHGGKSRFTLHIRNGCIVEVGFPIALERMRVTWRPLIMFLFKHFTFTGADSRYHANLGDLGSWRKAHNKLERTG